MRSDYLFTSESVSEGHPDKVSDQISDAIVDLFLSKDPEARVACETLTTTQRVVLAGEIRCQGVYENGTWVVGALDEIEATVRKTVKEIGYAQDGFHWETLTFENHLHGQSSEIAQGVDSSGNKDEGAGDQGIMFLRYENGVPVACTAVVVSTQHAAGYDQGEKEAELKAYVKTAVTDILPDGFVSDDTAWHINPTGAFEIGGPDGDAGLTGRKIIVDTYGGASPHGGGAFSGKDPTKVDRSAAYITRYLAKNIVAAGLAKRCTIQLAYAIGVPEPLSLYVDTHGTGTIADPRLERAISSIEKLGGLTPRGILGAHRSSG